MKKSNRVIIALPLFLVVAAGITDYLLAENYHRTDLSNVFRNFDDVKVKPFRHIKLRGGNGYSVEIKKASHYQLQLLHSRLSFFKMQQIEDTLIIQFNVANRNTQQHYDPVRGLIISAPLLQTVSLSGTSNIIRGFVQDSLSVTQSDRTSTALYDLRLKTLSLAAEKSGLIHCVQNNQAEVISLQLMNTSTAMLNGIEYTSLQPRLSDSAAVVFGKKNFER